MGMFSEIATESTIKCIVEHVADELKETRNKHKIAALKEVGRFALTQFEWSTPDWAKEYERLFKEGK